MARHGNLASPEMMGAFFRSAAARQAFQAAGISPASRWYFRFPHSPQPNTVHGECPTNSGHPIDNKAEAMISRRLGPNSFKGDDNEPDGNDNNNQSFR